MKLLIRQFGRLRLVAIVLALLPVMTLPVFGSIWLWQSGNLFYWLISLALFGALGFGLHMLARRRENTGLSNSAPNAVTQADSKWPPSACAPWEKVEAMANAATLEQWPLSDVGRLWLLGKNTLDTVARHYHPERDKPLLELTVPHALLIIERAGRDLRLQIAEQIPFSHQLSLGAVARAQRWKEMVSEWSNLYRLGRAIVNPGSVLFQEFSREVGNRIMGYGSERVQTWLLREYVRKVGYYAIELYSGNLLLSDENPAAASTRDSQDALEQADSVVGRLTSEPLRIVVLGRANAGKSSLINAMFGELAAAADIVADTTFAIAPYRLQREGHTEALIFDTPGCDTPQLKEPALEKTVLNADLILWVSPAQRPDRSGERAFLDRVRTWLGSQPNRRAPPLLVVVSHIDQLRPLREWRPPYNLGDPQSAKAQNIGAAVAAAAEDLDIPVADCIPVCLAEDRHYNVEDALWAAVVERESDADKARFLRCMAARRREENWALLWRQLRNTGRFLVGLEKEKG